MARLTNIKLSNSWIRRENRYLTRLTHFIAFAFLLGLISSGLSANQQDPSATFLSSENNLPNGDLPEDLLPKFQLPFFETENPFNSSELSGQLVYLDFWASWCSPCLESIPFLERIHQKYKDSNLRIVAINIDKNKLDAERFLEKFNISYTHLYDPEGALGKPLKVSTMPTAFLISPEGKILLRHSGFDKNYARKLELKLEQLLTQASQRN